MVNLALDELVEEHWLSVRSTNVCKNNGLKTLFDILDYFIQQSTFIDLPNCGIRSNSELIEMSNVYLDAYVNQSRSETIPQFDIISTYYSFEPFKRSVLNRYFNSIFKKLSVRAKNGLSSVSCEPSSLHSFLDLLFVNKKDFKEIRNIGKKTKEELLSFKDQFEFFFNSIAPVASTQLAKVYFKLTIQQYIVDSSSNTSDAHDGFFSENGRLHLFKSLKELVINLHIFNYPRTRIFLSMFTQSNLFSLNEVAAEVKLTRERVRQLSKEMEDDFEQYFAFIKSFTLTDCVDYGIPTDSDLIVLGNELTAKINKIDETNFNSLFYAKIVCLLLMDNFTLLDPTSAELKRSSISKRSRQDHFYLIRKEISSKFDFEGLLFDVKSRCAERITDSYSLYFEGYILDFFSSKPDANLVSDIAKLCRELLYIEMDLVVDPTGYLVFERNVKKQMVDYAIEVLEEIGQVSHISIILEVAAKKYPEVEFNEISFQNMFTREKDTFICISRSSTFGLKKWEVSVDNLKGGTIKTIVEEYLNDFDTPKHISEILEHVNRFRKTNEKNVMTNIEIDQSGRFVIFPGEYIGLSTKSYANTTIYKRLFGTHFRTSELKKIKSSRFDDIIAYYTRKYNYLDIQVRYTLMKRVANGDFILTDDNRLII